MFGRRHSTRDGERSAAPISLSRSSTTTASRSNNPFSDPPNTAFSSLSINEDSIPPPPPYSLQSARQSALQQPIVTPLTRQQTRPMSVPAPPPAVASPSVTRNTTTSGINRRNSVEDPLSTLGRYDIIILVDDSPSMVDHWRETRDALVGVVEKCVKYDKDGIDLWFLNDPTVLKNVDNAGTIQEAFDSIEPSGSTPTAYQVDEILRPYIERLEDAKIAKGPRVKPVLLLILTDGRADDAEMVKEEIIEFAQRLDDIRAPPYQLGISFIQVGNDPDASAFLKELDDDLKESAGVRDMCDTTLYRQRLTPDFILKACLGSVSRSLDARAS